MLKTYRSKRNFQKTPEPKPAQTKPPSAKCMHFVVHKHAARRLHYDLRLEHRGVLLSWAVPKGPGRKKGLKRLAIRVEDHPLSYKDFEGKIPEGEYGAGTVEIWDKGGYLFQGASSRSDSEKKLRAGLKKGHIAIAFYGKKLKGDYHLIQMKQAGLKNWLLYRAL